MSVTAENISNVDVLGRRTRLGVPNLNEESKLAIVKEKRLQQKTQAQIGREYGVNRVTVATTTEDSLSDESKAQLESFDKQLDRIRNKTAKRIQEKLDADTLPASVYAPLLKVANDSYRLETNQSTVNISVNVIANINDDITRAIDLARAYPDRYAMPERAEIVERTQEYCQLTQQEYDESELTCLALLDDDLDANQP